MTKEELEKLKGGGIYYFNRTTNSEHIIESHLECLAKVEKVKVILKVIKCKSPEKEFPSTIELAKQALAELEV